VSQPNYPPELDVIRQGEELDWQRIVAYIDARVPDLGPFLQALQFPNGAANLTYLLQFERQKLVLRRPPLGHIAAGAHDMAREYRALSQLWQAFPRAPRAYLFCEDAEVAGAPFLLVEYRQGQVIWGRTPPSMAQHPDLPDRVAFAMADALAELHLVDPRRCGLEGLGRAEGFLERQLDRWQARWRAVCDGHVVPLMDEAAALLRAAVPPQLPGGSILHNDYKLDNCQFDPANPDYVKSVFDWDMATIGDPRVDLGTMLNYWPDPTGTPECGPLLPPGVATFGLPPRPALLDRYCRRLGNDRHMQHLRWFEGFAAWKTGVVLQQLGARFERGETRDQRQAGKINKVDSQARRAVMLLTAESRP
jgi:aminoglycoside phosphotransferase (APT) family kinase protein